MNNTDKVQKKPLSNLFHNCINKLFSEENNVTWRLLEPRDVAGSPNINKVKQYEIVLSFKFSLFIQFTQSRKQRQCVYLVCFGIKKKKKSVN